MKQERRSQSRSKKEEEVDRSTSTTIGSVTVTDIASSSGRGDKSDKQHMPVKDGVQVPVPRSCSECSSVVCAHVANNLDDILYQNKIEASSISDVFYMQEFLSSEYVQNLFKWLKSLPHASDQGCGYSTRNHSSQEQKYNGKWTRLKFSQRNVALFDFNLISMHSSILKSSQSSTLTKISASKWPLLQDLCDVLVQIKAFPPSHPPNHILINEYQV
jgi:hypothetical protein